MNSILFIPLNIFVATHNEQEENEFCENHLHNKNLINEHNKYKELSVESCCQKIGSEKSYQQINRHVDGGKTKKTKKNKKKGHYHKNQQTQGLYLNILLCSSTLIYLSDTL